jgi:hypothetical protein
MNVSILKILLYLKVINTASQICTWENYEHINAWDKQGAIKLSIFYFPASYLKF